MLEPVIKSNATKKLFRANLIAAILCLLCLLWLAISYPSAATMWSHPDWVSEQIQKAKTMEELSSIFEMATSRVNRSQSMSGGIFGVALLVQFIGFAFLCINVYRIGRLHRAIIKDETA